MKTKVYLAGRIAGNKGYKEDFGEAERFYEDGGFVVLNPARLPEGMKAADYARICFAMIDSADAVVMLPDWEMSPGARLEKAYAEYVAKAVLLHEDAIVRAESAAVLPPQSPVFSRQSPEEVGNADRRQKKSAMPTGARKRASVRLPRQPILINSKERDHGNHTDE